LLREFAKTEEQASIEGLLPAQLKPPYIQGNMALEVPMRDLEAMDQGA
jgi:hypothetical protein